MVIIGISLVDSEQVLQFCGEFDEGGWLFIIVGVYFYEVSYWNVDIVCGLCVLFDDLWVCVVGECGFDFNCDFFFCLVQEKVFEE